MLNRKSGLLLCTCWMGGVFPAFAEQSPDASWLSRSHCQSHGSFGQSRQLKGLPAPLLSRGVFFNHCEHGVIWSTRQPVDETLVIRSAGRSYLIDADGYRPLKGYAGQMMSRLVHALMNGDLEELTGNFDISGPEGSSIKPSTELSKEHSKEQTTGLADALPGAQHFVLLPRTKKLRRGLQRIDLTVERQPATPGQSRVEIRMLDRDDLLTKITLTDEALSRPATNSCTELKHSALACGLLLQTPEPAPAHEG